MQRLSSSLFMISLLVYYIPKVFKMKKSNYLKAHIAIGGVSIAAMCIALIQKIGQADFLKYIGFAGIMILIGVTGYYSTKKSGLPRILHIISTISFFVYLFISIKFF